MELPGFKSDKGSKQVEVKRDEVKNVLVDFAGNTTAHGVKQVLHSTNVIIKLSWVLIMLMCFISVALEIHPLVKLYLSRPVTTRFSFIRDKSAVFPVVVLCNQNKLKSSKIEVMLNEYRNIRRLNGTASLTHVINDMPFEYLYKYGHQFNETVKSCTWDFQQDKCTERKHWDVIWNYHFGKCFVFNSGFDVKGQKSDTLNVSRSGPNTGLELTLDINQDEYDISNTDTVGMWMYVGDQGVLYSPFEEGISLSPGFSFNVALHKKVIKRADQFNNNSCLADEHLVFRATTMGQTAVTKHSKEFCYQICLAEAMMHECGCMERSLPIDSANTLYEWCTGHNSNDTCLERAKLKWTTADDTCLIECGLPCEETRYSYKIGMRKYPSAKFVDRDALFKMRENLLKVSVYFSDFEYELAEDYVYYKIENLLADIGGQLGLFVGYSFITFVEVMFLFSHLFKITFHACYDTQYVNKIYDVICLK